MVAITIYRGTREIGGTLIEVSSTDSRILLDAGYPLFLNGSPIEKDEALMPPKRLLEIGVLPDIKGLYAWDAPSVDAVLISHAHLDHYGLLKYINPSIPVYISAGTERVIRLSQAFKLVDEFEISTVGFEMYKPFQIGSFTVKPYLMDHSAFDAAGFEIHSEGKTIIYSGDFRGHGRKPGCLDRFINGAAKQADLLLIEGTTLARQEETIMTEEDLKDQVLQQANTISGPVLFQASSQNIDRLVSFYKVARKLGRLFVVDVYTANILSELNQLGCRVPFPSNEYENVRVFYPYRLTKKIYDEMDLMYAKRFSPFYISKPDLNKMQNKIVMAVRPSMQRDLEKCGLRGGLFIYSLWLGYRGSDYQQRFEEFLSRNGFDLQYIHTSGHASADDIARVIAGLNPQKVVPVHTMVPEAFRGLSAKTELQADGRPFEI